MIRREATIVGRKDLIRAFPGPEISKPFDAEDAEDEPEVTAR